LTAVLQQGRRRRTPRLDIAACPNSIGHPRLGVVVPRHGQSAVQRNRLRRRLREVSRRDLLPRLPALDLVVRALPAAYRCDRSDLVTDLQQWLRAQSA
jgi:ribonuclease P protein component